MENRRNSNDNGQGGEGRHEDRSLRDALPRLGPSGRDVGVLRGWQGGGVWVFRTVCFERVVLSSPGCLWPGRMDDHEEVLEAHA